MTVDSSRPSTVLSASGGHSIRLRQWLPDDEPRAVILILHGLAEHSARYERFAKSANNRGMAVVTYDHRGHGPEYAAGTPAHYADRNGWNSVVTDVGQVAQAIRQAFPDTPVVLLGHSMGSYIAQSFAMRSPEFIDLLVLSGSTSPNRGEVGIARFIAWLISAATRKGSPARLMNTLSFGKFNDAFKPNRTEFDWLSRDPAEVDKYIADPHCGQLASNRLWFDLLGGLLEISKPGAASRLPDDLPVLVFGGEEDPVGGKPGMMRLHSAYQAAGLSDVTLQLYADGRHEMLNETNRDEATADLLDWVEAHL